MVECTTRSFMHILAGVPGVARVNKVSISQKTLQPNSTQAFHVLVAISECHSPYHPRHSICLLPLLNPVTYVHPGIPSCPSVKSSLFLPVFPICSPLPCFPPHHCPTPHLPVPIPPSQSPPTRCHLSSHTASFLSSPSPPRSWPLPVPQHPVTHCHPPTDIYDHKLFLIMYALLASPTIQLIRLIHYTIQLINPKASG